MNVPPGGCSGGGAPGGGACCAVISFFGVATFAGSASARGGGSGEAVGDAEDEDEDVGVEWKSAAMVAVVAAHHEFRAPRFARASFSWRMLPIRLAARIAACGGGAADEPATEPEMVDRHLFELELLDEAGENMVDDTDSDSVGDSGAEDSFSERPELEGAYALSVPILTVGRESGKAVM
jgi:hypothetical protein